MCYDQAVTNAPFRNPSLLHSHSSFCVVIHDVASPFSDELTAIARTLLPLVGHRFASAVVPCWGGERNEETLREVLRTADCDEYLLHGWSHRTQRSLSMTGMLTGWRNEFSGMSAGQIDQRLKSAREMLSHLTGKGRFGMVPPCWQCPAPAEELSGVRYVMGYRGIDCCETGAKVCSLATWSWDWGWLMSAAVLANVLPRAIQRMDSDAIPCVVIHPADVHRGWLPFAVRKIETLLQDGRIPVTPGDLLSETKSELSKSVPTMASAK